jgi:hypothetical protein
MSRMSSRRRARSELADSRVQHCSTREEIAERELSQGPHVCSELTGTLNESRAAAAVLRGSRRGAKATQTPAQALDYTEVMPTLRGWPNSANVPGCKLWLPTLKRLSAAFSTPL